jgi:murein hydrolase activator
MPNFMSRSNLFVLCVTGFLFLPWPLAIAAPDGNLQDQQKNLQALRGRIEALRKELNSNETSRRKAQQEVREVEVQVRQLQNDLDEIARKRIALENRLGDLRRQSDDLSKRIAVQQSQLEKTIYQQYVRGAPEGLQAMLGGDDQAQAQRDQYYLTLLALNRKDLVGAFRADLLEKRRLASDLQAKTDELSHLLQQQQSKKSELIRQRDRHQELVMALSGKVEKQKQQISSLQQDEKRLSQLIDKLIEQIARKAREQKAAEAARLAKKPIPTAPGAPTASAPAVPSAPLHGLTTNLKMPVQGPIAGRFGSPRDGGGTWKGLFIHAAKGTSVKAIAQGNVVFADWMRGFGNLLILDHGDGYLSIYGYNESVLRKVGDNVKNGEAIASVGTNGGDSESGLYFEIRHHGRPLDPLKWASSR